MYRVFAPSPADEADQPDLSDDYPPLSGEGDDEDENDEEEEEDEDADDEGGSSSETTETSVTETPLPRQSGPLPRQSHALPETPRKRLGTITLQSAIPAQRPRPSSPLTLEEYCNGRSTDEVLAIARAFGVESSPPPHLTVRELRELGVGAAPRDGRTPS